MPRARTHRHLEFAILTNHSSFKTSIVFCAVDLPPPRPWQVNICYPAKMEVTRGGGPDHEHLEFTNKNMSAAIVFRLELNPESIVGNGW